MPRRREVLLPLTRRLRCSGIDAISLTLWAIQGLLEAVATLRTSKKFVAVRLMILFDLALLLLEVSFTTVVCFRCISTLTCSLPIFQRDPLRVAGAESLIIHFHRRGSKDVAFAFLQRRPIRGVSEIDDFVLYCITVWTEATPLMRKYQGFRLCLGQAHAAFVRVNGVIPRQVQRLLRMYLQTLLCIHSLCVRSSRRIARSFGSLLWQAGA